MTKYLALCLLAFCISASIAHYAEQLKQRMEVVRGGL